MSKEHIGDYLQRQLDRKGISQTELVTLIDVSRQTINKHINKGSRFKIDNYLKLSNVLDVTVDDLLLGGKKRITKLKKFIMKPIDRIKIEELPVQPDGLGMTLLDYVIETNNIERFMFFYNHGAYIEPLHNHIKLLCFLIKNNQYELLKEYIKSRVVDQKTGNTYNISSKVEFPVIDFSQGPGYDLFERNNLQYEKLNDFQSEFIDTLIDTQSDEIMKLIPYKLQGKNNYPLIFFMAIRRNKLFFVKYLIEKNKGEFTQLYFNIAVQEKAWSIAKYFFENMQLKTLENLRKIKDTKYKKMWKEKLDYS